MPCDNHDVNNVNIEFSNAIGEIECIINAGSSTRLILCGDWNYDCIQNTAQVNYLLDFIRMFKLHIAWSHTNSMPDHTYVNDSLAHKFHIDHYIVCDNVYHSIDGMHISLNGINLSKHDPIVMTINDGLDQLIDKTAHRAFLSVQKVTWYKVNDAHVAQYKECLVDKLNDIELPNEALLYKMFYVSILTRTCMLVKLCKDLIMSCIDVSNEVLP